MARQLQLDFSTAEAQRAKLTADQEKYIRNLYREAAADIRKQAERAPRVPSDALRKVYLDKLQSQIGDALKQIEGNVRGTVKDSMREVAAATVKDAQGFVKDVGLSIKGSYSHVPVDIVRSVASGQLYDSNWTLSKALWLNTQGTQQDVQSIVAKGILENKSAYDIAKDLEKYVNPDARKDWAWSKVYPGTSKVVDYNAQRLARTMVSHAYQQAFVRTTINNPFVTKYMWEASNSERTCQLCLDRDGQYFKKDELPLDHPNGMCTYIAVMEDDMNAIADRLADWAHGAEDPELDNWAKDLYGKQWEAKKQEAKPQSVSERVNSMTKIGDINKAVNSAGWFKDKLYLQGLDADSAKHVVSAYQRIFDRFPALKGQFTAPRIAATTNSNAYASCATATNGQIILNKSKFASWDALVRAYTSDVSMGFHPEGTTAEAVIIHEFGHAIDGWLARSGMVKTDTEYASSVLIEKAFDKSGMSTATVGWQVSSYAKKNDRECFAECFAQGMDSKDQSSLTKELMKDLDRLLGGK